MQQPPRPKRPGSRPEIVEVNAPERPHTPVPAEDVRPTAPPPFGPDPRPPPRNLRGSSPGIVLPSLRAPVTSSLREYEEEKTLVGVGPVQAHHDVDRDSGLHSAHGVFELLEQQKAKTDAAEARARLSETKFAALLERDAEGAHAIGPTITLGSAKWWLLVMGGITALCAAVGGVLEAASKIREWERPIASAAQVVDVKQDAEAATTKAAKAAADSKAATAASDQRSRITGAFLCAQGLRAEGLDCDALLKLVQFQAQPLNPNKIHSAPTWHTSSWWPPLPAPPDE